MDKKWKVLFHSVFISGASTYDLPMQGLCHKPTCRPEIQQ